MLPNLLVIGAAKCGTTSLHYYLGIHPEIFMSDPKELNFWQLPECLEHLSEYESKFPTDHPIRGESSIQYTTYPIWPGTAERIHRAVPDMKLIYLVRDPVSRAIADYVQQCANRRESRGIDAAFADPEDPNNRYIALSRYATQLEQYLDYFPRSNLLVLEQTALRAQRASTLRAVFSFLGVEEEFESWRFARARNRTAAKRRRSDLYSRLERSAAAGLWRRLPLPATARHRVHRSAVRLFADRVETPTVSERLRRDLAPLFRDEVRRLSALTGKSYSHWSSVRD
jgi:hypothetical protein